MSKFSMGQVVMTRGIADRCADDSLFAFFVTKALQMHSTGNWGDVDDEDWNSNLEALETGDRLFSSYYLDEQHSEKIWIITEADRSYTTVLWPSEY
ncbi:hypothetical protein SDC9_52640 [bioreactor metagenome]|uniref:Type I restriction endonuclease subunit M n=1 Tax=bioreactor metagenome TaxID=1076179 RepID=A0A644WS51_9ZZZZ